MVLNFKTFIGQEHIKKDLIIHTVVTKLQNRPLPNTILYGPAGLGKTSLAHVIENETGHNLIERTGSELDKKYLQETLKNIYNFGLLFIDEIHNIPIKSAEILYTPMQIVNNQLLQNAIQMFKFDGMWIFPFTVIGATTSAGMLLKPFRDRMILSYHFKLYKEKELVQILLNQKCPKESAQIIAKRARGVPRVALNFFLRIRNEAIVEKNIKEEKCLDFFDRMGINKDGYDATDGIILSYLYENKVASESELTKTLGIDIYDYKNIYEPFLLSQRVIRISSKGREITPFGIKYYEENLKD